MVRILVIDDDEDFRTILCDTLDEAGYSVEQAGNGMVGIETFRRQPADLVLTDLFMPEKEGVETIRELVREFPETPIIAMSGSSRSDADTFLEYAEKFGAAGRLEKPFSRQHLVDIIDKALANAGHTGRNGQK